MNHPSLLSSSNRQKARWKTRLCWDDMNFLDKHYIKCHTTLDVSSLKKLCFFMPCNECTLVVLR